MSNNSETRKIIGTHQSDNVVLPIIKANEIEVKQPPIGSGSFGKVFKGKCRGKDVAVKVLDGIEWDESVLDEFVQEVAIMAQLLHPNILLCMGACTEENFGHNNYAIIMEFMPRGDLQHILHNPDISLDLVRKLQFAIDICQGMAWLSGQNILHRDLKPANVLVDAHWCCKICDFGLSQIQRGKNKIRDEDEAPGSVLWMAPEVLLNENIDSKLDVYSFALVFWEILSRKDLFTEYDDKDIFTEDIGRKGVRPPLDEIDPILQRIIVSAWDRDPTKRPTFQELIILIEQAMIDIYLPSKLCPDAPKFWEKSWRGRVRVEFNEFVKQLTKYLEKRSISTIQQTCLQKIVSEEENGEKFISIESFSNALKWFGKMRIENGGTFLDRMETVLHKEWFFGGLSSKDADDKLTPYREKTGTFLVRLNMGGAHAIDKTPFTITRVDKNKKIVHTRVYTREDGGYLIQLQKGKDQKYKIKNKHNNIEDFISYVKSKDSNLCSTNCPGWPFKDIFGVGTESQYEEVND